MSSPPVDLSFGPRNYPPIDYSGTRNYPPPLPIEDGKPVGHRAAKAYLVDSASYPDHEEGTDDNDSGL